MDDEIIHVLMLNESATQKPTKFQGPHVRRATSTGFRSWFVNWWEGGWSAANCGDHGGGREDQDARRHDEEARVRTINWVLVSPGSDSTATLSAKRRSALGFSDMVMEALGKSS